MRVLSTVGAIWLLALMVPYSDAGVDILGFFFLIGGAMALALVWTVRYVTLVRRRKRDGSATARVPKHWALVPLYLAVGVGLASSEGRRSPLFLARFRLSEAALTSEAQRLLSSPTRLDVRGRRVGLFRVQRMSVVDGQVRFITTACGVVDACGLVYSPATQPTRQQEDRFSHVRGPWWHLYEGF